MTILGAFSTLLFVVSAALIINKIEDYNKQKKRVDMSFREGLLLTDLPIITFYNGGDKVNFLLDTGASESIIDSTVIKKLHYDSLDKKGTVFGMEGNVQETEYIKLSFDYKGHFYNDEFQVVDMTASFSRVKAETGVTLSGILGSKFFTKYKYVLDFDELIAYSKKV